MDEASSRGVASRKPFTVGQDVMPCMRAAQDGIDAKLLPMQPGELPRSDSGRHDLRRTRSLNNNNNLYCPLTDSHFAQASTRL
jgi:hypothetical protein